MSRSYQYSANQDVASNDLFAWNHWQRDPELAAEESAPSALSHADGPKEASRQASLLPLSEHNPVSVQARYPSIPGSKKDGTSAIAARTVRSKAIPLQRRVLEVLQFGEGLTADEVAHLLGRSILSVRPRCSELVALGKVKPTGQRRKNASGLLADVLKAI